MGSTASTSFFGVPVSYSTGTNSFYNPKTGEMEPRKKISVAGFSWFTKTNGSKPNNPKPNNPKPNPQSSYQNTPSQQKSYFGGKTKKTKTTKPRVRRCKGKTYKRTRCHRKTVSKSGFCKHHTHRRLLK